MKVKWFNGMHWHCRIGCVEWGAKILRLPFIPVLSVRLIANDTWNKQNCMCVLARFGRIRPAIHLGWITNRVSVNNVFLAIVRCAATNYGVLSSPFAITTQSLRLNSVEYKRIFFKHGPFSWASESKHWTAFVMQRVVFVQASAASSELKVKIRNGGLQWTGHGYNWTLILLYRLMIRLWSSTSSEMDRLWWIFCFARTSLWKIIIRLTFRRI